MKMFTKKKILALVMLLAVIAPLLFFTCFFIKQKMIEHDMEEQLKNASLKTITIDAGAILWVKRNKEVTVDGKLFDVRSITVNGNVIILTGLYDNEEDILNEGMKNFVQQKNEQGAGMNHIIFSLLFPPLYNHNTIVSCQNIGQVVPQYFVPYREEQIFEKYLSILTPPPRLA